MTMHEGWLKSGGTPKAINSLSSKVQKSWRGLSDHHEANCPHSLHTIWLGNHIPPVNAHICCRGTALRICLFQGMRTENLRRYRTKSFP